MTLLRTLVILQLVVYFDRIECSEMVSGLGKTELFVVNVDERLNFAHGEHKCKEVNATLPEIYDEEEWTQVSSTLLRNDLIFLVHPIYSSLVS